MEMMHRFAAEPLLADSLRYSLPSGETFSFTRLSYLLSGFALETKDGVWLELPGQFAWMDAVRRRCSAGLTGVPAREYRAIRFAVGLDAETNAADPAQYGAEHPLNPNLNGLHWSWQGGYIFMALEGYYRAGNDEPCGYSWHFARSPNRTVITLPAELMMKSAAVLTISFDLAALLNAPRPLSMIRDGDSTHSRDGDVIAASLKTNLANAFQVHRIETDAVAAPAAPLKPLDIPAAFTAYRFRLNGTFPIPPLPRDNPLLEERVALGRRLFHEPLLSRTGALSCASCHEAAPGFSDPRRYSPGVDGQAGMRQAMPLFNLAWKQTFFWDGRAPSLREQARMPIKDHREMDEKLERVVEKLAARADYPALFGRAFDSREITPERIGLALENYLLTLVSDDSKFDRAMKGAEAFTEDEQRGFELFFTEYEPRMGSRGADCFHCHGGALFSDHQFHNNGLGDPHDEGLFKVTGKDPDKGKFATPSLRNVAVTAPYMHDGRMATLEEVVDYYAGGLKRSPGLDPNLAKHPAGGLPLTADDKHALVAFLKTLTDDRLQTR